MLWITRSSREKSQEQALRAVLGPAAGVTLMGLGEEVGEAVWFWDQRTAIAGFFLQGS